jgi:8-oxo-dGTP pyrophosphatase MutT (NUDIX family)
LTVRTARAVSAGGVVLAELRPDAPVALVAHRSVRGSLQWTLPKGAREEGESVTQTALREVREETGLEAELIGPLDTIDYWFVWAPERTRYHKYVHYFLMRFVGGDFSYRDHEMEDAAWFEPAEARRQMAFANERKLLDLIQDVLAAQGAGGS